MKNMIKNKIMNKINNDYDLKVVKINKNEIFNNFYSINSFETNLPVKVINLYNIPD